MAAEARGSGGGGRGRGGGSGGGGRRAGRSGGGQGGRAGKPGSARKGATSGSGGYGRRRLEGRGATPPAEQRTGHPAARRGSAGGDRRRTGSDTRRTSADPRSPRPPRRSARPDADTPETVAGRNPVVEALRAKVPAGALYVGTGLEADERVSEALTLAGRRGIPVLEAGRGELDRMTGGAVHQGLALQVPPYSYLHPDDLLARAAEAGVPLLVALDGVTDPRNLGAVVRSAAAFGAHGVLVPERRSAGLTAAAWKASAGAAARLPVARATNLVRALKAYAAAGLTVVGLEADGEVSLPDLEVAVDPVVLVVGSEGGGLSRLVGETCDLRATIPMAAGTESLNAGVAAAVALYHCATRRGVSAGG